VPALRLPEESMDPEAAYRFIHDELMLDGSSRLNLATFVTTWMEPEAEILMAECSPKNMIDKDEYPQTAELEQRCVNILSHLWNAPAGGQATGCSTTGSSEACMLGGMALLWRWRARRQAARAHAKAAAQRQDTARKWAKNVVRDHDVIAVEDFRPKFLAKTTMARKAADAAIGAARRSLLEMAARHGRAVHLVDPAYTTMDCSRCGARAKSRLLLSERTYTCSACGVVLPRDKNSAAVTVPKEPITSLASLKLAGTAVSGGIDTLVFTAGAHAYSTTGKDSVTYLASDWKQAEFNIVGDGGGSKATFNRGSSVTVRVTVAHGSTAAPSCASNAGTTGETNNLTLGSCSGVSGATPYIQFKESN